MKKIFDQKKRMNMVARYHSLFTHSKKFNGKLMDFSKQSFCKTFCRTSAGKSYQLLIILNIIAYTNYATFFFNYRTQREKF